MQYKAIALASLLLSNIGSIAVSCTLDYDLLPQPLEYKKDCSFRNAGQYSFGSGDPSNDLGGGIVYQIMRHALTDDLLANWVVADCKRRVYSVVTPKVDTHMLGVCMPNYKLDEIKKPSSPLMLALKDGGLEAFEHKAAELGYKVGELDWVRTYGKNGFTRDTKSLLSRRVDPFCGCKVFYPSIEIFD